MHESEERECRTLGFGMVIGAIGIAAVLYSILAPKQSDRDQKQTQQSYQRQEVNINLYNPRNEEPSR